MKLGATGAPPDKGGDLGVTGYFKKFVFGGGQKIGGGIPPLQNLFLF